MGLLDVYQQSKKHQVMQDTWGHLYPKPGQKYYGEMLIAIGEYGDQVIVKSDFPGLDGSPQRFELERSIFDLYAFESGVYKIKCGMWFYKSSSDMYLNKPIGKLIKIQYEESL